MKTIIQKLPLDKESSFVARTYETPNWETPYHVHDEFELMVISKGEGTVFVGDFIGEYQTGDVYLFGGNLPHWFKKATDEMIGSSMVVQFRKDFLGNQFFDVPEMAGIKTLLEESGKGIVCTGELRKYIGEKLIELESLSSYEKAMRLVDLLHEISESNEIEYVSKVDAYNYSSNDQVLVKKVFEYSFENYKRKIMLSEVAELTNKSVSSFSHYFKKTTKIGYVQFLTQLRISNACRLLKETDLNVTEICYQSGFGNWANFSKHFKTIVGMTPSTYRMKSKAK